MDKKSNNVTRGNNDDDDNYDEKFVHFLRHGVCLKNDMVYFKNLSRANKKKYIRTK